MVKECLDYEDFLIQPHQTSRFKSRSEVSLVNDEGHVPVCAANMGGVGTLEMALALQEHRMLTFVCKETSFKDWTANIDELNFNYIVPTFGITDESLQNFKLFTQLFPNSTVYACIDVANGHMKSVIQMYKKMQKLAPNVKFVVGNIANLHTLRDYDSAGIWAAKVGIGSGSVCTTRVMTGIGVPQASLVRDMAIMRNGGKMSIKIIADGGVKTVGDIAKAFVLGADYVMLGGMLSGHDEGGRDILDGDEIVFMGSSAIQTKDYVTPEGKIAYVPYKGRVENTVTDILGGLRSAGSYLNAHLDKFKIRTDHLITVRRQKNDIYES